MFNTTQKSLNYPPPQKKNNNLWHKKLKKLKEMQLSDDGHVKRMAWSQTVKSGRVSQEATWKSRFGTESHN